MLKPRNLSTVQPIQILRQGDIRPIDAVEQDLESAINNAYQEINSKDQITVISQKITNRVYCSCHYLLSNYFLENRHLYYYGKLYLPNIELLCFWVLQEPYDQSIAGHPGVAKIYKILQRSYYWPKIIETIRQYIRNCHICARVKLARNR